MDLESVFDGPLSTGSLGEKSGKGVSVWQAEVALRLSFLRKVYGILTAQLVLSVVIAVVCLSVPQVKGFVQTSPVFSFGTMIATFVVLIALIFKRHDAPSNYYLLLTFTLLEGISLGTIVTFYDVDLVLKAFVITSAVFIALTVYTMQSKYDFSTWGASLFALLWVLIIASMLQVCHVVNP